MPRYSCMEDKSMMMDCLGKIKLYNADCMDIMRDMPDGAFDLAIVDPPYGINAPNMNMGGTNANPSTAMRLRGRRNSGDGKLKNRLLNSSKIGWDNETPTVEYFQELRRVSRNQIIWGGNYFDLPPTRCVVCWDKLQPWENFSQFELAWTSFDMPAAMFKLSNTVGTNREVKIHPTQKPVALYKWLLAKFAKPGDQILDTHLGSGSSAIAAHDGEFEFVGIELDANYYISAKQRIAIYQLQRKLF